MGTGTRYIHKFPRAATSCKAPFSKERISRQQYCQRPILYMEVLVVLFFQNTVLLGNGSLMDGIEDIRDELFGKAVGLALRDHV